MKTNTNGSTKTRPRSPVKITARPKMEDLLTQENILLQTLIDLMPDRIYVKDLLGRKIICNEADWRASGGKSRQDVLGKTDFDTYSPEMAATFWEDDQRVLVGGEVIVNREEPGRAVNAGDQPVWVLSTKVPMLDSQGKICGLIGIGREITTLKLAQKGLHEQTECLQIAADMARTASSTLDFDQLLARVIGLIEATYHYYHVGIYLADTASEMLTLRSAGGHAAAQLMLSKPSLSLDGRSLISLAVHTHQPCLVPNVDENPDFAPHALLPATRSEAVFPLAVGKKVIGVLDIQTAEPEDFQNSNLSILKTLADQVAMAIQNAYLYKQSLMRTEQLQKLASATANIMGQLGRVSLEQVLTLIAKYSTELLDAETCGVSIVKRPGFLTVTAGYGHREGEFLKGLELEIKTGQHTGLSGHIAWEGKLFNEHGERLTNHDAVREVKQNYLASGQCHSLLAIPLFKGFGGHKKLVGLLRVENKKRDGSVSSDTYFQEADEWILSVFANTVVMAIESAQLVDEIRRSRRASQEISKASTIGKLDQTLKSIVEGAQSALNCDIATLYMYGAKSHRFIHAIGVGCDAHNMIAPENITENSTVWKILHSDEPIYVSEDVVKDEFFNGSFAAKERVLSALAVKLKFMNKPMGVLFIDHRDYRQFTKDEINVAKQFGHQAAVAIRNTQLYEETYRLSELLQSLNLTMTSRRPLEETLSLIVQQAVRMSGITGERADYGYISLLEGNRLQYRVAWPKRNLSRLKQTIGDIDLESGGKIGVTGRAVKQKKTVKVGDVSRDRDYIPINSDIHSELAVPIKYENQVVGVINLEHNRADAFDDYDVYVLEKLAAQVAITIQTARHFEEIRYDASVREGLLKVGQAILETQKLNELLKILVNKIQETLETDFVTLYTYDPSHGQGALQVNYAGTLLSSHSVVELNRVSEHSIVREILHTKKPIFADDTLHERTINKGDFPTHEKVRSSAGIPLLIDDQAVGVVFVNYRKPHQFSAQQRDDLQLFATQVALAIQNARRYEDIKQQKGLVGSRTALAFMGMTNSIWGHSIQGHAINIRMAATLLRQDLQEGCDSPQEFARLMGRLDLIESQVQKVIDKEMIPQLSEENAPLIKLNDLIQERINQLRSGESYKGVRFQLELGEEARVKMAPVWFQNVLDIVVDNGIKAMEKTARKKIKVRTRLAHNRVEILVTDVGHGISPELRELILNEQIVNYDQNGLGLGLLMAQAILQSYGGDIKLERTGPTGTTFSIVLPVAVGA